VGAIIYGWTIIQDWPVEDKIILTQVYRNATFIPLSEPRSASFWNPPSDPGILFAPGFTTEKCLSPVCFTITCPRFHAVEVLLRTPVGLEVHSPFGPFRVRVPAAASKSSIVPVKNFAPAFGQLSSLEPRSPFLQVRKERALFPWHTPRTIDRAKRCCREYGEQVLILILKGR